MIKAEIQIANKHYLIEINNITHTTREHWGGKVADYIYSVTGNTTFNGAIPNYNREQGNAFELLGIVFKEILSRTS